MAVAGEPAEAMEKNERIRGGLSRGLLRGRRLFSVVPALRWVSVAAAVGLLAFGSAAGSLAGRVWHDLNGNGVWEGLEPGLPGIGVSLVGAGEGSPGSGWRATTDSVGRYAFQGVPRGVYRVLVDLPGGWMTSYDADGGIPGEVRLETGDSGEYRDLDFGITGHGGPGMACLASRVFYDLNADGIDDGVEPGIGGLSVRLTDLSSGSPIAETVTDRDGRYAFTNLLGGDYSIVIDERVSRGSAPTSDPDGTSTPNTAFVLVPPATHVGDVTFGYFPYPGSLRGRIWEDRNGSGTVDRGEAGIAGAEVIAVSAEGTYRTTAQVDGSFQLEGVKSGLAYVVSVVLPSEMGLTPTVDPDGVTSPNSAGVFLGPGEVRRDLEFGYGRQDRLVQTGVLQVRVWDDADGDGRRDPGEGFLEGTIVLASGGPGEAPLGMAITGMDGIARLTLSSGRDYWISALPAPGHEPTAPGAADSGGAIPVRLEPGVTEAEIGFRLQRGGFGDRVWQDSDGDGVPGSGERGLDGLRIVVRTLAGVEVASVVTGPGGGYRVEGLPPGPYWVQADPGGAAGADGGVVAERTLVTVLPGVIRCDVDLGLRRWAGNGE